MWKTGKTLPGCVSASGIQGLCPVSEMSGRVLHEKNVLRVTFLETPEGLTPLTLPSPSRDRVKVMGQCPNRKERISWNTQ